MLESQLFQCVHVLSSKKHVGSMFNEDPYTSPCLSVFSVVMGRGEKHTSRYP